MWWAGDREEERFTVGPQGYRRKRLRAGSLPEQTGVTWRIQKWVLGGEKVWGMDCPLCRLSRMIGRQGKGSTPPRRPRQ